MNDFEDRFSEMLDTNLVMLDDVYRLADLSNISDNLKVLRWFKYARLAISLSLFGLEEADSQIVREAANRSFDAVVSGLQGLSTSPFSCYIKLLGSAPLNELSRLSREIAADQSIRELISRWARGGNIPE